MGKTTDRRTFLLAGGAGLAAAAVATATPAAAGSPGRRPTVTDLGEPVHKTQTLGSVIGTGSDGRPLAYFCGQGNPTTNAEFAVVDIRAQSTLLDVRLPAGQSVGRSMSISATTGTVYFGTTDTADLYRYQPGAAAPERLTTASTDQQLWEVRVGADDVIWMGTYPGGRLLSYDPATGRTTDHGQALTGEQYVGALAQVGEAVYCGTQPNGRLVRFDIAAGTFTEVAFPDGPVAADISQIDSRGDKLFVSTGTHTYVRDLATDQWIDDIPDTAGYGVSPVDPDSGRTVYVSSAGQICGYNLDTGALTPTGWAPNATPEAWAWIDLADPAAPGPSLAFTYWNHGRIYGRNLATRTGYYHESQLLGVGDQLVAIGAGPDGNIYCGAYLSPPGMGRFDPDTGQFELLSGTSQIEGFGSFNGDLVFGRYPQGRLYRYDLDQPFAIGTNPGPTVDLEPYEQNRPQCFLQLDNTTVAVTSVPITGRHGGAITLWQPDTNQIQVFRGVVANQTPVSLVRHGRLLIGGTSINGGYGIDPVTAEATLFAWDPHAHRVVFTLAPVRGATTIAGLVVDEHHHIWGLADSVLFQFDPATRRVRQRHRLFADTDGSRYGNDHVLLIRHGRMFGVTANRVFEFDRSRERVRVRYDGVQEGPARAAVARHLATDHHGDLYFIAAASHLFRSPRR